MGRRTKNKGEEGGAKGKKRGRSTWDIRGKKGRKKGKKRKGTKREGKRKEKIEEGGKWQRESTTKRVEEGDGPIQNDVKELR